MQRSETLSVVVYSLGGLPTFSKNNFRRGNFSTLRTLRLVLILRENFKPKTDKKKKFRQQLST